VFWYCPFEKYDSDFPGPKTSRVHPYQLSNRTRRGWKKYGRSLKIEQQSVHISIIIIMQMRQQKKSRNGDTQ
jgi:predicted metalloenzyme YecM